MKKWAFLEQCSPFKWIDIFAWGLRHAIIVWNWNIFCSSFVLNNAQHFNFFVHVEAWNISGANLSCQKKKKKFRAKDFGAKISWQFRVASIAPICMKFSIWKNLSHKILTCIDKIEKMNTFGTINFVNLNKTLSSRTVSRSCYVIRCLFVYNRAQRLIFSVFYHIKH